MKNIKKKEKPVGLKFFVIYRMIRGTISQSYTSIRLIRMNHAQSIRLIILYSDNSFLSLKQQLLNTEYKPPNFHLKDIP